MEPTNWTWIALGLSFAIMIIGIFVVGRSLPDNKRVRLQRKFLAVAAIPLILTMMFPRPFVWEWTRTWAVRDNAQNSNSPDVLAKRSLENQQDIKDLQQEVEKLRKQVAEVNDYYGRVTFTMLTGLLVICVVYPLTRRKEDLDTAEASPLGLNQTDDN